MKTYLIPTICIFSIIFGDTGWIEVDGKEVSDHELTILIKEDYAPLLGEEPKLELASIPILDIAVSSFSTKEFEPLFYDYEIFTENHRNYNLHRYYTLRIDSQESFINLIDEISTAPEIELIEYKYKGYLLTTTPNDPFYGEQWAHNNDGSQIVGDSYGVLDCDMDTDEAWDISRGNSDIIIAILDSGLDMEHPEFTDRIVSPWDYFDGDDYPEDMHDHGTACAGIAAASGNNNEGVAGICWDCNIMPIKVSDGIWVDPDFVANGIQYAHDNGADVISMSFYVNSNYGSITNVINYAYDNGTILFAATGNSNASSISFPASVENCIAVGAHSPCNERKHPNSCDGLDWGSQYGAGLDFLAPGIVLTTGVDFIPLFTRNYLVFDGTSAACPHAAGVAGLILSVNPQLTPAQVRGIMQVTSVDIDPNGGLGSDGYDIYTGYGRINAYNALANVLSQKYFHTGWNWVGFPVLMDNEDGIVNNDPDPITDVFNEIESDISSIYIEEPLQSGDNPNATWELGDWDLTGDLNDVNSLAGYFVEMPDDQPYYNFQISGERIAEVYPIELDADENWIPYFIPESQHPGDAFPQEVLDHMTALYSEHWFMIVRDGELIIKSPCPDTVEDFDCYDLQYGAMYKVVMSSAMAFTWNDPMGNGSSTPPNFPQMSSNFPFEPGKEYIPLVIEEIENGQDIVEIGAMQDSEYVGAELVGGYPINMRVYADDLNNISFEVITSGDSLGRTVNENPVFAMRNKRIENGITVVTLGDLNGFTNELPKTFSLVQAYPNPFNPSIDIRFDLNVASHVELNIFNLKGQHITTLLNGQIQKGRYSYTWNGMDNAGNPVSSGVYFYRLRCGDEIIQNKIMFLK